MEREWPQALKCDMSGGANRRAPGLVLRLERPGRKARGSLPPAAPTSRLQTTPRALLSGGSSRSRPYLFIVPFPRPTKRAAGLAVLPLQGAVPYPRRELHPLPPQCKTRPPGRVHTPPERGQSPRLHFSTQTCVPTPTPQGTLSSCTAWRSHANGFRRSHSLSSLRRKHTSLPLAYCPGAGFSRLG